MFQMILVKYFHPCMQTVNHNTRTAPHGEVTLIRAGASLYVPKTIPESGNSIEIVPKETAKHVAKNISEIHQKTHVSYRVTFLDQLGKQNRIQTKSPRGGLELRAPDPPLDRLGVPTLMPMTLS